MVKTIHKVNNKARLKEHKYSTISTVSLEGWLYKKYIVWLLEIFIYSFIFIISNAQSKPLSCVPLSGSCEVTGRHLRREPGPGMPRSVKGSRDQGWAVRPSRLCSLGNPNIRGVSTYKFMSRLIRKNSP